jgi:hypothetical protein
LNQLVEGGQYFVEIEVGGLLNQLVEGGQYFVEIEVGELLNHTTCKISSLTRLKYIKVLKCFYNFTGNMFSSLAGLEFEWSLLSDADKSGAVDAYNILRFVMKKCHSFVKDDVIISLSTFIFLQI